MNNDGGVMVSINPPFPAGKFFASVPSHFSQLAIDENALYLAATGEGILKVPLASRKFERLSQQLLNPTLIVAGEEHLFCDCHFYQEFALYSVSKKDGALHKLFVRSKTNAVGASCLALDSEFLYWADKDERSICRVPRYGGEAEVLVTGCQEPKDLMVLNGVLYWSDSWGSLGGGVFQAPIDGSEATQLLKTKTPYGARLWMTDAGLYCGLFDAGLLLFPWGSTSSQTLLKDWGSGEFPFVGSVTSFGEALYWRGQSAIYRLTRSRDPFLPQAPVELAYMSHPLGGLVANHECIFWTEANRILQTSR
jgi:hypothetical protein